MNKKIIEIKNMRKIMDQQKPPIPTHVNTITMKEGPPDKTKELLDPEDVSNR